MADVQTAQQSEISGGNDHAKEALRSYWAADREAGELEAAAWKEPTPDAAYAALMARKRASAAWHEARSRSSKSAKPAAKKQKPN